MRLLISALFILITVLSVFRPMDSFCASIQHSNEIQNSDFVTDSTLVNAEASEMASADHLACDICHIGHCSFMMGSGFVTASYGKTKLFGTVKNKIQFSEFNQNLFRPPIA